VRHRGADHRARSRGNDKHAQKRRQAWITIEDCERFGGGDHQRREQRAPQESDRECRVEQIARDHLGPDENLTDRQFEHRFGDLHDGQRHRDQAEVGGQEQIGEEQQAEEIDRARRQARCDQPCSPGGNAGGDVALRAGSHALRIVVGAAATRRVRSVGVVTVAGSVRARLVVPHMQYYISR
jgi:hypothetical protein